MSHDLPLDPIDSLMADHELILTLLEALAALPASPTAAEDLARWRAALELVRGFADVAHHAQEERILFPALARAGLPLEHGPLACMRHEHEEGRACVRAMDRALSELAAGQSQAAGDLRRAAADYVALLRQHIAKENQVLFPMARQLVPAAELTAAGKACLELQREVLGAAGREGVRARVLGLLGAGAVPQGAR